MVAAEYTAPTKPRSLFEIGEDLIALEQFIESLDGDISGPGVEEKVMAWFEGLGVEQAEKLDRYINLMRKWEMESVAARAEAERYHKAAVVRDNRVERFKARLMQHLEQTKQKKIETASGRVLAIQANGGKLPLTIDDVDPANLAPAYQQIVVKVDAEAVRKTLEAGGTLEFARLGARGSHLRIK